MDIRRTVTIELPDALLLALGQAARAAGCSPSDYVRAVLRGALDRSPARLRPETEEILQAIHLAQDWVDLQRRLRARGHVLRRTADGGLAVHSWPVERAILPLSAIGLGEADLTLRFGRAFPADVPHASSRPAVMPPGRAA